MWFFNEEIDMALAFLCLMVMGVIAVGVMLTGLRGMTLAASRPAFRRWNYHWKGLGVLIAGVGMMWMIVWMWRIIS